MIAKIASKDMLNLGVIFDTAKTMEAMVDKKAGGPNGGYDSAYISGR